MTLDQRAIPPQIKLFVRMRHWHIFVLVVALPLLISRVGWVVAVNPEAATILNTVFLILLIIPFGAFYGWLWAVGSFVNRIAEGQNNSSDIRFLVALLLSAGIGFFLLMSILLTVNMGETVEQMDPEWIESSDETTALVFVYVMLVIMFISLFYCLNFLAKRLVRAEHPQRTKAPEYFSEFVMAAVFPIGIWFLQPRVNSLYSGKRDMGILSP